ncbi:MAG: prepilin peptidase [Lachnospiraceae bacterium]|nr:prepilin peptidase [Lachnospiraceae bacterium]
MRDAQTVRAMLLIAFAAWCTVCDLRTGKIPNKVPAAGTVCAVILSFAADGSGALKGTFPGACFPLILLPLFCLRMIGGGDIKLLCMAGAFLGWPASYRCLVLSFFAGGILSFGLMCIRGNFFSRMFRLKTYLQECLQTGQLRPYLQEEDRDGRFCFSCAVFAGIVLCLIGMRP